LESQAALLFLGSMKRLGVYVKKEDEIAAKEILEEMGNK